MKKSILYILTLLVGATLFFACEEQNTPDPVRTQYPEGQSPIVRDNAYYARLREYKKTPHKLAFGWYGSWTAVGSSEQTRMRSAPDSMDIISLWSTWHSLTKAQIADKAFVQQTLGTKVVFCISARDIPAEFKTGGTSDGAITEEGVIAFAKAWGKDSMDKYQYDGMDIDFETASDHLGPFNKQPAMFKLFCVELSKYIGPKSGTGRLFLIDGNLDSEGYFPLGVAELCNYAVSQAYDTSNADQLDRRVTSAANRGWTKEQMIFTENYEKSWQNGGPSYTCSDKISRPSLLGMADYAKTTTAAGFGSYHMEYEYGHSDMPYKHIRRAIQLANPAPLGDYTKNLVTLNETADQSFSLIKLPSNAIIGGPVATTLSIKTSSIVAADTDLKLMIDNSRIAAYNDYYFTEYKALDPKFVTISGPLHVAAGTQASKAPVTISIPNFAEIAEGDYLLPICFDASSTNGFAANTAKEVKYLIVKLKFSQLIASISGADKVKTAHVFDFADNTFFDDISTTITAKLTIGSTEDISTTAVVDPALVAAYNTEHGTTYAAVKAEDVRSSNAMVFAKGEATSTACTISVPDLSKIPSGKSLIAVRLVVPKDRPDYKASETLGILYIVVDRGPGGNLKPQQVLGNYATECDYIVNKDNTLGWVLAASGNKDAPDLKTFTAEVQTKIYNDGYPGWYADSFMPEFWPNGLLLTLDMKVARNVKTMLWVVSTTKMTRVISAVQTSMDGVQWTNQNNMDLQYEEAAKQGVTFINPVNTRFIRLRITGGYETRLGMKKIEVWTPKAI